jgi:hypothetical protein
MEATSMIFDGCAHAAIGKAIKSANVENPGPTEMSTGVRAKGY